MATSIIDYKSLVDSAEGKDAETEAEHPAYEFSSKTFYETDDAGVYGDDE